MTILGLKESTEKLSTRFFVNNGINSPTAVVIKLVKIAKKIIQIDGFVRLIIAIKSFHVTFLSVFSTKNPSFTVTFQSNVIIARRCLPNEQLLYEFLL